MDYSFPPELDATVFEEMFEGKPTFVEAVFDLFLSSSMPEFWLLENAFLQKEIEIAKSLTHKLKPIFTMLGIPNLTRKMEELEAKINLSNLDWQTILSDFEEIKLALVNIYLPVIEREHRILKELKQNTE